MGENVFLDNGGNKMAANDATRHFRKDSISENVHHIILQLCGNFRGFNTNPSTSQKINLIRMDY